VSDTWYENGKGLLSAGWYAAHEDQGRLGPFETKDEAEAALEDSEDRRADGLRPAGRCRPPPVLQSDAVDRDEMRALLRAPESAAPPPPVAPETPEPADLRRSSRSRITREAARSPVKVASCFSVRSTPAQPVALLSRCGRRMASFLRSTACPTLIDPGSHQV